MSANAGWVVLSTDRQSVLKQFIGLERTSDGGNALQKVQLWGEQFWFEENGPHSQVDNALNALLVARSTKEELKQRKLFNPFKSKQRLRVSKNCPSKLGLDTKVPSKYQSRIRRTLKKRQMNAAYSLWKEAIAARKDPRVKGYAEVVASPTCPFYLVFNPDTVGRNGKLSGRVHIYMGIEFGKLTAPYSEFPEPVRIGSNYR